MSWIRRNADDAILTVRVQPRAARNGVAGILGDALKIRLQAPPVDGKANRALVRFLATQLKLPRARVELTRGKSSRTKQVRIRGCTAEAVANALAPEVPLL